MALEPVYLGCNPNPLACLVVSFTEECCAARHSGLTGCLCIHSVLCLTLTFLSVGVMLAMAWSLVANLTLPSCTAKHGTTQGSQLQHTTSTQHTGNYAQQSRDCDHATLPWHPNVEPTTTIYSY
jgi:hypothetical protein